MASSKLTGGVTLVKDIKTRNIILESDMNTFWFSVPVNLVPMNDTDEAKKFCKKIKKAAGKELKCSISLKYWVDDLNIVTLEVSGLEAWFENASFRRLFLKEDSKLDVSAAFRCKNLNVKPRTWKNIEVDVKDMVVSFQHNSHIGKAVAASSWNTDGNFKILVESLNVKLELQDNSKARQEAEEAGFSRNLVEVRRNYDIILVSNDGLDIKCHSMFMRNHGKIMLAVCQPANESSPPRMKMNLSSNSLKPFLFYLYSYRVELNDLLKKNVALQLLQAGRHFQLPEMVAMVVRLLADGSTVCMVDDGPAKGLNIVELFNKVFDCAICSYCRAEVCIAEPILLCENDLEEENADSADSAARADGENVLSEDAAVKEPSSFKADDDDDVGVVCYVEMAKELRSGLVIQPLQPPMSRTFCV